MTSTGTFGNWSLKAADYNVEGEILGQGASATVHKATHIASGQVCAIKKIDLEQTRDESAVQKEIRTLSSFKNENITAYYGCFLNKSKLWILIGVLGGFFFG